MDWHYPRKALAAEMLDGFNNRGQKAYLIFERRRIGKTEFLQKDLDPMARKHGFIPVYISFYEATVRPVDLLNYRFANILNTWETSLPRRSVRKLEVKPVGGIEFERLPGTPAEDAPNSLLAMDHKIGKLSEDDNVLLLLDEFQDVRLHPGSDAFLKQLRSSIDARSGRVCAVFTGSSQHGLREIFHDRRKPFYGFATQIDFPAFDEAFVNHCRKGYRERTREDLPHAEAMAAFEAFDRITAHFRHYVERRVLTGADHAAAMAQVRQEYSGDFRHINTWLSLDPREQAMLLLICASGEQGGLYSEANRGHFQALTGADLLPNSTDMQPTVRKLLRKRLIDKQARGVYHIADPRFSDFVIARQTAAKN